MTSIYSSVVIRVNIDGGLGNRPPETVVNLQPPLEKCQTGASGFGQFTANT